MRGTDTISAETGKPVGPLHGLPIGIKDTYHMANKATTMGVSLPTLTPSMLFDYL
jgi:Asp-tRNA(Asn)/Glu-tRNA(Gln) amidotransferase A subunit family amidase